jgi:uncharacterized protein with GYD domain
VPRYIVLMNWTDPGAATLDDLLPRAQKAREALEAIGGRWIDEHYTLGAYDVVVTVEAPSDEQLAAFTLGLAGRGDLRTMTLRAFDREAMAGIVHEAKIHGGKIHGGKIHGGEASG